MWATGKPRTPTWPTVTDPAGSTAASPGARYRDPGFRDPGRPVTRAGPRDPVRSGTQVRTDVRPDLLDGPVVAVGIGEEDELPAIPGGVQYLHRSDLDAALGQSCSGRLDVGDHQLQAGRRSQVSARRHHLGPDRHRAC